MSISARYQWGDKASWWREKYAETGDQQYLDKMLDNVEMQ